MNDPIQPFRDEFERYRNEDGKLPSAFATDRDPRAARAIPDAATYVRVLDFCPAVRRGQVDWCPKTKAALRAAKALLVAETEGTAAALLWKLAN